MDPVRTLAWVFLALLAAPIVVLLIILACYVGLGVGVAVTGG